MQIASNELPLVAVKTPSLELVMAHKFKHVKDLTDLVIQIVPM